MVMRIEGQGKLEEFEGKVESVTLEESTTGTQYHIVIEPVGFEVGGKTGKLHEWIPMSKKATQEAVPQGSVMDRYLQQVEIVVSGAKNAKTVEQELGMLVGKKFKFKKIKLGKDYDGHPARDYAVPVLAL